MDPQTKTGKVYLQPHKAGKKWKPVWLSLFPHSSSGVGRLEIQDVGGGTIGGDHRKQKVIRLSELLSVLRLPPNAEACPMDNMAAFCVETHDRTMVFAALKDECVDWVEKLCLSTFQRGGGSSSNQFRMEDNQIYASTDEAADFWVVIQRTDPAVRCGLQGAYWLQVGREALLLSDPEKKKVLREWPYELLRRYGNDKLALTIEAGRRCDSGPGTFTFETPQAEKIFSLIQSTIKRKTSSSPAINRKQESEKAAVTTISARSPLPTVPDTTNMAAILENHLRMQDRKSPTLEEDSEGASAQPAPITLMPLPSVPTHDSPSGSHGGGQSDAVYADPADCVQPVLTPQPTTALYVDPASFLPLKPPGYTEPAVAAPPPSSAPPPCPQIKVLDPVYSEVYDKISPHQNKPPVLQNKGRRFDEPIYAEPEGGKDKEKTESKPDPFAHLYAQVRKTPPSSGSSSSPNATPSTSAPSSSVTARTPAMKPMEESFDDVIYENLGII